MGDVVISGKWTRSGSGSDTGGGNPPGGNDVDARVAKLESAITDVQLRLVRIETRLESVDDRMATKADLQEAVATLYKAMNEQTWKFIAGATAMAGVIAAVVFGMARLLN